LRVPAGRLLSRSCPLRLDRIPQSFWVWDTARNLLPVAGLWRTLHLMQHRSEVRRLHVGIQHAESTQLPRSLSNDPGRSPQGNRPLGNATRGMVLPLIARRGFWPRYCRYGVRS
jgi:hypothetical protein